MSIHESITGEAAPPKPSNPSVSGVLAANWPELARRAKAGAEQMQQVAESAPESGPNPAEITAEQQRLSKAFVDAQKQPQQPQEPTNSRAGRAAQRYVPQPKKQNSQDTELEF
ncbi:hypothetical protein [Corynebacterium riegelii]|uniref:hypothetical protein n=1 Tax=Corynebacterium riegelii TaxID=156976 RepID=UPI0011AE771D|nr:hypothetical protein [Corynebacterium riegelii]